MVSKLFRAYGLYNILKDGKLEMLGGVSKLFRAYGLYNVTGNVDFNNGISFQSSFELTGYITKGCVDMINAILRFQSSFELTGYITEHLDLVTYHWKFQSSFELTGYITHCFL